jgi:hypothetical protein
MGKNIGSFGSVVSEGNKITIEVDPGSLGDIAVTSAAGRIQCFWDGVQWVCNSIEFSLGETQNPPKGSYGQKD